MKYNIIFTISILFLTSCSISNKIVIKKDYIFNENSQRKLILTFQNDSVCTLKNIYNYEKIEENELVQNCRYKSLDQKVLLINDDDTFLDTLGKGYFYFPSIEKSDRTNLDTNDKINIGPKYISDKERYAKVPFIDMDTVLVYKRKLIWIKKDKDNKVVGYYEFK